MYFLTLYWQLPLWRLYMFLLLHMLRINGHSAVLCPSKDMGVFKGCFQVFLCKLAGGRVLTSVTIAQQYTAAIAEIHVSKMPI